MTRKLITLLIIAISLATATAVGASELVLQVRVREFSIAGGGKAAATIASRGYLSRVLNPGKRFNLVGITWRGRAKPGLSIRVRRVDRSWTRWAGLDAHTEHGPDANSQEHSRRGSDPIWVGQADRIQYRLSSGHMKRLRLHFVNSTGTATPSDRLRNTIVGAAHGAVASIGALIGVGRASAEATQPPIIPRAQWAGSQCNPRANPSYGQVKFGFVHHTDGLNDYQPQDSAAIVLAICRFHRDTRGWNDIGYNFLVDKYGQIFEGRSGGIDKAVVGAQAEGYNSVSTGIANLGTFDNIAQTPQGLDADAKLLAWKLGLVAVGAKTQTTVSSGGGATNRYSSGSSVTFEAISGHRDGDSTDCPGNVLYTQLPQLRDLTANYQDQAQPAATVYSLSASASEPIVSYGNKVTLSGALTQSSGQLLPAQALQLELSSGSSWHRFRTVTTGAQGEWSSQITGRSKRSYRAVFRKPDGSGLVTSSTVTVDVKPSLSVRVAGGINRAGSYNFRRGQVERVALSAAPKLGKIALIIAHSSHGLMQRVARKTLATRRRGVFHTYLRLQRRGTYSLSAYYPGKRGLSKARSLPASVRVR